MFVVAATVAATPTIIAFRDDVEPTEIHNFKNLQTAAAFHCTCKSAYFTVFFDQYVLFIYNSVKQ